MRLGENIGNVCRFLQSLHVHRHEVGPAMLENARITTAAVKIAFVTSWLVLVLFAAFSAAALVGPSLGQWIGAVGVLVLVVVTSRTFRLPGEPSRRAWWQMTSRPGSGLVLAAVFASSPAVGLLTGGEQHVGAILIELLIASTYGASSIAQGLRDRQRAG